MSLGSGDRTPKQKVKLKVTEEKLLNLMLKYNGGRPRSEVVLCLYFFYLVSLFSPEGIVCQMSNHQLLVIFSADETEECCPAARFARCHSNACSSH